MGRIRASASTTDPVATDAALAGLAAAGDIGAFEELYRRHAQAAWRVAQAVTGNAEDSADAVSDAFTRVFKALPSGRLTENANFRAYLLSATRNAALDVHRRTGRVRSTDDDTVFDRPSGDGPSDQALQRLEAAMVASAFRSLPERWRSVLWLTEVEGIPAREAAGLLGVSANGVAQLAVRARAGLRERFLQAHITHRAVDDGCRATVEKLGAYVAGALAPRDLAKVDQHLAGCDECRARKDELEDLGSNLRRIILPFPLGLGALALGKWELASSAAASTASAVPRWLEKAQRPLAVASVGLFAAGILGVGVVGQPGSPRGARARDGVPADDVAAPAVTFTPAASVSGGATGGGAGGTGGGFGSTTGGTGAAAGGFSSGGGSFGSGDDEGDDDLDALENTTATTTPVSIPPTTLPGGGGSTTTTSTTTPTTPTTTTTTTTAPPPKPTAQVVISVTAVDATTVAAGAGNGSCTGINCPAKDEIVYLEATGTTVTVTVP